MPRFLTANVVAFCAYFATFAVFFFTALYLEEVVGDTGYQIALVFLPMTVLMIAASLLAGRWTDPAGPRWSIFIGCLLFGAGLLLTTVTLSPHPSYLPLAAALALTGVGIGATVVPITSAALSAVPPARSGMAASATNTSREIGAVTGVAILGALVNAQLRSSLTSRLHHLGIPANFQSIVIHAVETGGVPSNGNTSGAGGAAGAGQGALVQEVIHAAYSAFYAGLHAALLLSAFLVLAAGLFTFVLLGRRS
jgi:predicted MFS family arabinose efflux permease